MSNMMKAADLSETLQRMGSGITSGLGGATDKLKDWYSNLDPEARSAILRGLAGAAVGGGLTGGMALMTPRDPEEARWKSVINPALLGATLGGIGAAGLPVAEKMFGGQIHLSNERRRPLATSISDTILGVPLHNPAATIGTVAGGVAFGKHTGPHFSKALEGGGKGAMRNLLEHIRHGRFKDVGQAFERGGATKVKAMQRVPELAKKFDPRDIAAMAKRNYRFGAAGLVAGPLLGMLLDKYIRGDY